MKRTSLPLQRRQFIAGLGSTAAWPLVARAQQGDRVRRIGVLAGDETDPVMKTRISAFTQALAELGWIDGRNVRMDLRWAGADNNRTRALAQELVSLQPEIIVTNNTLTTAAVQRETRTIPIVFGSVADPVASGIVVRLDRPTGNVTGFAILEAPLGGKWLELLSQIAPGLKRAAIMFNLDTSPASLFVPSFETAARSLKVVPISAPIRSDAEIEAGITALGREPGGGFVVISEAFAVAHRAPISGCPEQGTGGLFAICLYQRWRLAFLRSRPGRPLSSCGLLCGSCPTRRETRGATRSVADKIRDGRKP
jgi:putative ABC transport system substrate-binding protein